jgi:hypothetical protein
MNIKNLLIIGDSYSTFKGFVPDKHAVYYTGKGECGITSVEETWWKMLIDKTGINLVLNSSWSGSTICYTGRVSPEYGYRSSFVNRMHIMLKENFFKEKEIDTVFIFGGTNDSWLDSTPKGSIQFDGFKEEDLYSTLPAICYMAKRLREELPNGNIVFIINTELDERISSTMKIASEHFGTQYIELTDIDKESGHPTVLGMKQIAEQILNFIEQF